MTERNEQLAAKEQNYVAVGYKNSSSICSLLGIRCSDPHGRLLPLVGRSVCCAKLLDGVRA